MITLGMLDFCVESSFDLAWVPRSRKLIFLVAWRPVGQRPLSGDALDGMYDYVGSGPVRPLYDRVGWIYASLLPGDETAKPDVR